MINDVRTIYGKAEYCWLSEPDTKFNSEGVYHVDLIVKKEGAKVHIKAIQEEISKEVAAAHKTAPKQTTPLKRANTPYEDRGEEVVFKIKSKFRPKIWDRNRKELDLGTYVYRDSTMWAHYKITPYNKNMGIGATLYLQDVQIDNLVKGSGSGNGSCSFPKREGSALPGPEKEVY